MVGTCFFFRKKTDKLLWTLDVSGKWQSFFCCLSMFFWWVICDSILPVFFQTCYPWRSLQRSETCLRLHHSSKRAGWMKMHLPNKKMWFSLHKLWFFIFFPTKNCVFPNYTVNALKVDRRNPEVLWRIPDLLSNKIHPNQQRGSISIDFKKKHLTCHFCNS